MVAQSLQQGRKTFSIFETKKAGKTANLPGLNGGVDNDSSGEAGGRLSGGRKHVLLADGAQPMTKAGVYHTLNRVCRYM